MRINSDFHDYYDVIMGEGQDQSLVYQRHKKEELITSGYPFHSFYSYRENLSSICVRTHNIGFCGKVYDVLEMIPSKYKGINTKEARSHRRFCYSLEEVDAFVKANFKPEDFENYKKKGYSKNNTWYYNDRRHSFEFFFQKKLELQQSIEKRAAPYFEGLRPIFVATYGPVWESTERYSSVQTSSGKIVYNCPLKQYEFYRLFPPFQAFQEINMWLSNQAVPIKPIPEMTDQIKLEAKGFDKFSFRKPKTSEKRKK